MSGVAAAGRAIALGCLVGGLSCAGPDVQPFSNAEVRSAQRVAAQIQPQTLQAHVAALVAARRAETPVISPYSLKAPLTRIGAAAYISTTLQGLGYTPNVEVAEDNGLDSRNIVADVPGVSIPDEIVLVTGHYDAWYQGGADDNATAVATLLETARVLKGTQPARTVRFVAFDREEEGLIGAVRFARLHAADRIVLVLNMDPIGFASHASGSQSAPPGLGLRDTGDFVAVLANDVATDAVSRVALLAPRLPRPVEVIGLIAPGDVQYPATANFLRSDQAPFWQAGIPALFFTDTANFRNPNYHTPNDVPETLDYDFLGRVASLVAGVIAAAADVP